MTSSHSNAATGGRAYDYRDAGPPYQYRFLLQPLQRFLTSQSWPQDARALDYGCGNGWFAGQLSEMGFATVGIDISEKSINLARRSISNAQFLSDISPQNLVRLGPFDMITCIEVIAHCYSPSEDLATMFACLRPGGKLVMSTPYHGYLKNLAMAATGVLDKHLDASSPGAWLYFFSPRSISNLLVEAGFRDIAVTRVGRVSPLARSMIVTCVRPDA